MDDNLSRNEILQEDGHGYEANAEDAIWENLKEPNPAYIFIDEWVADPDMLLANIISAIANKRSQAYLEDLIQPFVELKARNV